MAKLSDRDRILQVLGGSEGLSSRHIKSELDLSDERYTVVRAELLKEGLVKKYVCRGGGLRLTKAGDAEVPKQPAPVSDFDSEDALYGPFVEWLKREADEGPVTVVCRTHSLRKKGQWQNPDVTEITLARYKYLGRLKVVVTTYELKQFPNWNIGAVFEAASHKRFANEAYVVLEWPRSIPFSLTDLGYRMPEMVRECQRFGIGLATLHKHYNSIKMIERLKPNAIDPVDEEVEGWLGYVFERLPESEKSFLEAVKKLGAEAK